MNKAIKVEDKCDNAPYCKAKRQCPVDAITYNQEQKKIVIDHDKCTGCGKCVEVCPRNGLKLTQK